MIYIRRSIINKDKSLIYIKKIILALKSFYLVKVSNFELEFG